MTQLEQLRSALPLLGQINEGKQVEYIDLMEEWASGSLKAIFRQLHDETFNPSNWRVKPDAPKVVPYSFETAPIAVKARCKTSGALGVLYPHSDGVRFAMSRLQATHSTYPEALEFFELLEGSPYGIPQKEESEWPRYVTARGVRHWLYRCDSESGPVYYLDGRENEFLPCPDYAGWKQVFQPQHGDVEVPRSEALALIANAKEAK